ncbi:hypothetical protein AHAS_Ahas16G0142700 [Arachis hypogaea]
MPASLETLGLIHLVWKLVHCRWAMLGAAGIFISEFLTSQAVSTPTLYSQTTSSLAPMLVTLVASGLTLSNGTLLKRSRN